MKFLDTYHKKEADALDCKEKLSVKINNTSQIAKHENGNNVSQPASFQGYEYNGGIRKSKLQLALILQ
ncbi:MAG: hypothetical protein PUP93_01325 [Rhizonema sp. NSF051]|nr:hypothetical protein [Rhizonema sp. NSF051]